MSDGHDRLRQYLEQRRELGESEFVLDGLSVEDALRMMTGRAPSAKAAGSTAPNTAAPRDVATRDAANRGSPARDVPRPARPDSEMRRNAEAAASAGDWREALRAVDAAAPSSERPTFAPNSASASVSDTRSPSATGEPLIIGASSEPSGLNQFQTLEELAAAVASCTRCTLANTAKNPVPGEGNSQARFVVVGEAPGQSEDELGRPFVGRSGDLLTKILDAIGFKREDVFICNVLKHRPPGNRNPARDEILACRPFLLRQLELLQPKVILAVGTFAAQTLLESDSPVGTLRGLEHRYHGIPLVATYHPAALLRNPKWKRPAWEDVQLARRIFDRP